jgi:hypothetical protein
MSREPVTEGIRRRSAIATSAASDKWGDRRDAGGADPSATRSSETAVQAGVEAPEGEA